MNIIDKLIGSMSRTYYCEVVMDSGSGYDNYDKDVIAISTRGAAKMAMNNCRNWDRVFTVRVWRTESGRMKFRVPSAEYYIDHGRVSWHV